MHVVTFRWRRDTTEDQVAVLSAALDALAPQVSGLRDYRYGSDLGLRPDNVNYAVAATLDSAEDLPHYLEHPEHLRIVSQIVSPMLGVRQAVQITLEE